MTGGHGDLRQMGESRHNHGYCSCGDFNTVAVIADGVDECLKAAREELRRGAHCIKIMGSGGVASPTDPIWMNQYREDEIRAIVGECAERRTYVASHCHPRSEEHTSELQSLMRNSYAVFCLKKKTKTKNTHIMKKIRKSK